MSEEAGFRRMLRYVLNKNLSLFLGRNLLVDDDEKVLRLYREKRTKNGLLYYDLGIIC